MSKCEKKPQHHHHHLCGSINQHFQGISWGKLPLQAFLWENKALFPHCHTSYVSIPLFSLKKKMCQSKYVDLFYKRDIATSEITRNKIQHLIRHWSFSSSQTWNNETQQCGKIPLIRLSRYFAFPSNSNKKTSYNLTMNTKLLNKTDIYSDSFS